MVAVVAAVGRQIEGHREALLPGRDVAPVKGVGILGRGKARVLANGPRLGDVHGGIGAAQIGGDAGVAVEKVEPGAVGGRVDRLDGDAFWGEPGLAVPGAGVAAVGVDKPDAGKIRYPAHVLCPIRRALWPPVHRRSDLNLVKAAGQEKWAGGEGSAHRAGVAGSASSAVTGC